MGEANQSRWWGIRPTDPEEDIPVKQFDPADLQATVRIRGWDDGNSVWRDILVNAEGKLIIDPTEIFEDTPTDGETGKAPTSNWALDHKADASAHHSYPPDSIKEQGAGAHTMKCKVIDIGDWDMDTDATKNVAHGLSTDYKKIRSVRAIIRNDTDVTYYPLDSAGAGGSVAGGIVNIDGTNIQLIRETGGIFDGVGFTSTSYNRGWVFIWYEV